MTNNAKDKVRVRLDNLIVDYERPEQYRKVPVFPALSNEYFYPYPEPLYEHMIISRNYKTQCIVLENKYLKLVFTPQWGGRMFSMYDKLKGREAIFRTDMVSIGGGGIGHNYMGGGMELNYPDTHSITNARPREMVFWQNPDGSASVTIAEIERVYRSRWAITFILYPHEARIEQRVRLYNRTEVPIRFRYWANCGIPCDETHKSIYPEKYAKQHGAEEIIVPWPKYLGVDCSELSQVKEMLGLYMVTEDEGYFGAYLRSAAHGIIHVANPGECPGKKYWSWGAAPDGLFYSSRHSKNAGCYMEIQSGRIISQDDFEELPPMTDIGWTEYWYPYRDIGIFQRANKDVAILMEPFPEGRGLQLGIYSPIFLSGIEAVVEKEGGIIFRKIIDLSPELPVTLSCPDITFEGATLILRNNKGSEILRCPKSPGEETNSLKLTNPVGSLSKQYRPTAETWAIDAEYYGLLNKKDIEERNYARALELDPNFSSAQIALALKMLKKGQYEKAIEKLSSVAERNRYSDQAYYYRGLAHYYLGHFREAERDFYDSERYGSRGKGEYFLGVIASRKGNFSEASAHFARCQQLRGDHVKVMVHHAAMLRKLGQLDRAASVLAKALAIDRTDVYARVEQYFVDESWGKKTMLDDTEAQVKTQPHAYEEVAYDYDEIGLWEESLFVLERLVKNKWDGDAWQNGGDCLLHIHRAYLLNRLGRRKESLSAYQKAEESSRDFAWPHRYELFLILKEMQAARPRSGLADYLLGTLYVSKERLDEGAQLWSEAGKKKEKYWLLYRNLGYYQQKIKLDKKTALIYSRQAWQKEENNIHFMAEYFASLRTAGKIDEALEIGRKYKDKITQKWRGVADMHLRQLIAVKRFQEADKFVKSLEYPKTLAYLFREPGEYLAMEWAMWLFRSEKYKEALGQLARAKAERLAHFPFDDPRTAIRRIYYQGLCCKKLGNSKEAQKYFITCISTEYAAWWEPSFEYGKWLCHYYHTLAYRQLNRRQEAMVAVDGLRSYSRTKYLSEKRRNYLVGLEEHARFGDPDVDIYEPALSVMETSVEY